jgi:hypothetical protein
MRMAASPLPPARVVPVGDDQAGANSHDDRPRKPTRNSGWGAGAGGRACPVPGVPRRACQGARKFSQYREGVGPRCPWYLERDPREP